MTSSRSEVTILLVDDNAVDVMGVQRALRVSNLSNPVVVATDGVEALARLKNRDISSPYLVLLDLNMPRMNGVEFLSQIRADPDLKKSVVFVLTTSSAPEDRYRAYEHNVAGYIVKGQAAALIDAAALLGHYMRVCELP